MTIFDSSERKGGWLRGSGGNEELLPAWVRDVQVGWRREHGDQQEALFAVGANLVGDVGRDENAYARHQLNFVILGESRSLAREHIDDLLFMWMRLSWGERASGEFDQPKGKVASPAVERAKEIEPVSTREMIDRAGIDVSDLQFSHLVLPPMKVRLS
jgi:hypothetical protein